MRVRSRVAIDTTDLIGRTALVTGTVCPGHIGEVRIHVGGGIEAFYAVPYDGVETIEEGAECAVVDYRPQDGPRTVLVAAMP
jgi:hypothetical protein